MLGKLDPSLLIDFGTESEPGLHRATGRGLELTRLAGLDQRGAHLDRELHDDLIEPEDNEYLAADRETFAAESLPSANVGPTDEVVGEPLLGAVGSVDYWSCSLTT